MRIALLYNPLSGRGQAAAIARAVTGELVGDGHEVRQAAVVRSHAESALPRTLAWDGTGAQALVIIGGDGTVHHALGPVLEAGTPVYQLPLGTENLFARQFGMTRDVGRLRGALAGGTIVRADIGVCNGVPFSLMCSIGPDANVVHRLARVRGARISHLSYLRPGVVELVRPAFAAMSVEVDGRRVVDGRRGVLVVANSRQYAMRIDPATRASMSDGLLDVVFLPCSTSARVLRWALSARLRRHLSDPAIVYATGREVRTITTGAAARYQIDGEAAALPPTAAASGAGASRSMGAVELLEFALRPGALRVLMP